MLQLPAQYLEHRIKHVRVLEGHIAGVPPVLGNPLAASGNGVSARQAQVKLVILAAWKSGIEAAHLL